MHEASLVQALLDRVEAEARARSATAVTRVEVRLGELAGVVPELFAAAFAAFREGTLCAGAELAWEAEPVRWECPGCGAEVVAGGVLRCAACGRPAKLAAGSGVTLMRFELEVPDV